MSNLEDNLKSKIRGKNFFQLFLGIEPLNKVKWCIRFTAGFIL